MVIKKWKMTMKKMPDFIEVYDNAITSKDCKNVIKDFESNPDRHDTTVHVKGRECTTVYKAFNNTQDQKTNEIVLGGLKKPIDDYVRTHSRLINDVAPMMPFFGYNVQKYTPGEAYHKSHCENDGVAFQRVLAWMFYLNTVEDEGGTYFEQYDKTVNATRGRCVVWPAYWTHFHNGIASKTETKYIITGWMVFRHLMENNNAV